MQTENGLTIAGKPIAHVCWLVVVNTKIWNKHA